MDWKAWLIVLLVALNAGWMVFDGARALTRTDLASFRYSPGTAFCPLVEHPHWNHHNVRITGAAVEDYVGGALRDLIARGDVADAGGLLTRDGLERAVFRTFFFDMAHRSATIYAFRDAWNARFPGNPALAEIMARFSM